MNDSIDRSIHKASRLYDMLTSEHPGEESTAGEDRETLLNFSDKEYVRERLALYESFDTEQAWKNVVSSCAPSAATRRGIPSRVLTWGIAAAAVVALVVTVGISWRGSSHPLEVSPEISQAMAECEEHGMSGARIEQEIALNRNTLPGSKKAYSVTAKAEESCDVVSDFLEATRITTYINKEFWTTLPDGTVVHLARDTRIIYPETFGDDSREVYLSGDAFFMVAHDRRPFYVHTDVASVTVHGTEFHISSRGPSRCEVVLVEGSLSVTDPAGTSHRLVPGQMIEIADTEVNVSFTDVAPYVAWNTGHVDISEWPLGAVMDLLGRWYGYHTYFSEPDNREVEISGNLDRYDDLGPTLESLSSITGFNIRAVTDTLRIQ